MASAVLPAEHELAALVAGPGSLTRRRAADARIFAGAGFALLLQVAHPTVGAGVAEHSNFRADPWGRLLRTLDFTNGLIFSEPREAARIGRGVREMHKRIAGTRPDGVRYHALEPEAYAWVHATLYESIVRGHELFGNPLDIAERTLLWDEWRRLGRLLGVRERDLPGELAGYRAWFDGMVRDRLEDNETVQDVLDALVSPTAPPLPAAALPAWRAARLPAARALRLATVGMLPAALRTRFGLSWSRRQELELRAVGAASRAVTPVMPRALRQTGPAYLRWRARARAA